MAYNHSQSEHILWCNTQYSRDGFWANEISVALQYLKKLFKKIITQLFIIVTFRPTADQRVKNYASQTFIFKITKSVLLHTF